MRARRFLQADGGTAGTVAVEFAFILPVLLALLFAGYAATQAVALGRKVTITTRALADLTTQFATMSATDVGTVMNASAEIIAPFDSTSLQMRLTEITTDATGLIPRVQWCVPHNMAAYATGSLFPLPLSMLKPNTSYILSETKYLYNPLTNFGMTPFTLSDHVYMLPRLSTSVSYTG